jgi:hypothetical protein
MNELIENNYNTLEKFFYLSCFGYKEFEVLNLFLDLEKKQFLITCYDLDKNYNKILVQVLSVRGDSLVNDYFIDYSDLPEIRKIMFEDIFLPEIENNINGLLEN